MRVWLLTSYDLWPFETIYDFDRVILQLFCLAFRDSVVLHFVDFVVPHFSGRKTKCQSVQCDIHQLSNLSHQPAWSPPVLLRILQHFSTLPIIALQRSVVRNAFASTWIRCAEAAPHRTKRMRKSQHCMDLYQISERIDGWWLHFMAFVNPKPKEAWFFTSRKVFGRSSLVYPRRLKRNTENMSLDIIYKAHADASKKRRQAQEDKHILYQNKKNLTRETREQTVLQKADVSRLDSRPRQPAYCCSTNVRRDGGMEFTCDLLSIIRAFHWLWSLVERR